MSGLAGILGLSVAVGAYALAQQPDPRTVPGAWRAAKTLTGPAPAGETWATRDLTQTMQANLAQVADIFRRTPALAQPIGLVIFPHINVQFDRGWNKPHEGDRRWLIPGYLLLAASYYEADGKTAFDSRSAFVISAFANNLQCVFRDGAFADDAEGTMYFEPAGPVGAEHGHPVFEGCVVVTHRPGPFWVPVSRERVIKVKIAEVETRLAKFRESVRLVQGMGSAVSDDQKTEQAALLKMFEGRVKAMRDLLDGLDANARRQPATIARVDDPAEAILNTSAPRIAVVQPNPAFFDAARPADIQILTVFQDCVPTSCDHGGPAVEAIYRSLDWAALAALVK